MRGRCVSVPLLECRGAVDSHWQSRVPDAALEYVLSIVAGHIPFTAHNVVDVVACLGGIGTVFAGADAEFGRRHKVLVGLDTSGNEDRR
jgi:hypothetical protein